MIRFLAALLMSLFAVATASAQTAFTSDRIGVTVRGDGPDVVLIPGLSSSPEVWDSTIAALPGYRYHLVHVSGFAGRPAGANADGPVLVPVAEEIARYIRDSRLDRPAIVGHSMGGSLGMIVAARNPNLAGRLMVVDMFPFLGAMFAGPDATAETLRPMAEMIRIGIASAQEPQRTQQQEATIASMVRTESLRPLAVRHGLASDDKVSGQGMYDLITTNLMPELSRITVPVTVLWVRPPNAPISQEQMAEYYRASYAGIPNARLIHVPNAYHFIMWDEPESFQRELRTFLEAR